MGRSLVATGPPTAAILLGWSWLVFLLFSFVGDFHRDRRGLRRRLLFGPLLVLLLLLLVLPPGFRVLRLFGFARQIHAQLVDQHHNRRGQRQRQQGADDTAQDRA